MATPSKRKRMRWKTITDARLPKNTTKDGGATIHPAPARGSRGTGFFSRSGKKKK